MDALLRGGLDRAPALVDIFLISARQAADHRAIGGADLVRNRVDRVPIAGRGGREASLDDVDAQARELAGHLELLFLGHRAARRLLAVAQGRIENTYLVGYVRLHRILSLSTKNKEHRTND